MPSLAGFARRLLVTRRFRAGLSNAAPYGLESGDSLPPLLPKSSFKVCTGSPALKWDPSKTRVTTLRPVSAALGIQFGDYDAGAVAQKNGDGGNKFFGKGLADGGGGFAGVSVLELGAFELDEQSA